MNGNNHHLHEEEIVDLLLGKVLSEKRLELESHLAACGLCQNTYQEWREVLVGHDVVPAPSATLKKRIRRKIVISRVRQALRPAIVFPALSFAVLLFLWLGWSAFDTSPEPVEMARDEAINGSQLLANPKTIQLEVEQAALSSSSQTIGYIWLNNETGEVLMLLDGISPAPEQDYQVWFIQANRRSNGGLLQWKDGVGHFYLKGTEIQHAENMAVSIEPKGGSPWPTGPDAVFVNLRAK